MLQKNKVKLAIAPIAWSNDEFPELGGHHTFEQCIKQTSLSGYTGSEIGNMFPKDVTQLKKVLDKEGVQICNAWFETFFTTELPEVTYKAFIKHRDFLNQLGAKVIGCSEQGFSVHDVGVSIFDHQPTFNQEEWQLVIDGMNHLGKLAKEVGMKLAIHHHIGTAIQSIEDIDYLLSKTSEDVYLLLDTGHIVFAEKDKNAAFQLFEKHMDRVAHIHLKDIRMEIVDEVQEESLSFLESVKRGVFTVPGDGCIDFEPIFELIDQADYNGWLVVEAEQDPDLANPFEYALLARNYINAKTGL